MKVKESYIKKILKIEEEPSHRKFFGSFKGSFGREDEEEHRPRWAYKE